LVDAFLATRGDDVDRVMLPDSYMVVILDVGVGWGALNGSPAESGSMKVDVTRLVETLPEEPFCEACKGLALAASSFSFFELGLSG
jgi:hypothetical protein